MNDRFNNGSSVQGLISQVFKELQTGLNRLEQAVNQANQSGQGHGWGTPSNPAAAESFSATGEQTASQAAKSESAPSTPYTGQRWEYKVVYVNFRGQISSEGQQYVIGRGERRSSFVRTFLDQIGSQGWELSGVSPLGETENSYFIFKRPTTGEAKSSSTRQSAQVEEVDENGSGFVATA